MWAANTPGEGSPGPPAPSPGPPPTVTPPDPPRRAALDRAAVLLRADVNRLDNVWGVGGGQRPVKHLVREVSAHPPPTPSCSVHHPRGHPPMLLPSEVSPLPQDPLPAVSPRR